MGLFALQKFTRFLMFFVMKLCYHSCYLVPPSNHPLAAARTDFPDYAFGARPAMPGTSERPIPPKINSYEGETAMPIVSDLTLQKEQEFFAPISTIDYEGKIYPFSYQFRRDLPEEILGAYIYHVPTATAAFVLNSKHFADGFELRSVNLVWAKVADFHLRVLAGEIGPPPGSNFIWKRWRRRECCINILPPPNARWIIPLSN